jgi:hypothetical protein
MLIMSILLRLSFMKNDRLFKNVPFMIDFCLLFSNIIFDMIKLIIFNFRNIIIDIF